MVVSRKIYLTAIAITALSLLAISAYAARPSRRTAPQLGIEIALKKPFYMPAAVNGKSVSAVVKPSASEGNSEHEPISGVKLVTLMEGDKVRVTVFALIGEAGNIKTCKEWDALKSIKIGSFVAGLDEEVSISQLRNYGVSFETGNLKFRVVPKRVFPQLDQGIEGCGCASCGGLQCCPNPGYCIKCGSCATVCCNPL
jgi:hypothetical protein